MSRIKNYKYLLLIILSCLMFVIGGIYVYKLQENINKETQNASDRAMFVNYSFKIGGNANKYLLNGWYNPETNFTWASENAEIEVPMANVCDYDIEIKYSFHTLSESTSVFVNDKFLTTLNTDESNMKARISRDILNEDGNQIIAFRTSGASSPYSLGEYDDARVLGIAIHSINMFPVEPPKDGGLYSRFGMIYFLSGIFLIAMFMMYKKNDRKQNFWRSLAMAIVSYECYLCMVAGIMTIIHIPVDVYSISIVNIIVSMFIALKLIRENACQQYYLRIDDTLFIIFFAIVVINVFFRRFTPDLEIIFETSDPGVHLKMAMDFVNSKSVDNMYIGQLLNGLLIESLMSIFDGELVYKSFIIQCGINFFVAGIIFWAVLQKNEHGIVMRLMTYVVTLIYLFGYPYNDFLYGFVYLQMTITVICYLIALMQEYLDKDANIWVYGMLIGAGCLSVGIGYTLFAPPIYISILALIMYKAYQEKWFLADGKRTISRRFILCGLCTFLLATFVTLWFIVIGPRLNNGLFPQIGNSLLMEGGIYRNLFSDFLLYSFPAICGIVYGIKEKKINYLSFLCPIIGVYYFYFMYRMLSDKVSTYYFYKFNYLIWMIILVCFAIGIEEFFKREKVLFVVFISGIALLASIYITKIEDFYYQKNNNYIGYTSSNVFFRIYECNKSFVNSRMQIPKGLVEISNIVLNMNQEESVIFIGHWMHLFWYEALSNQRLGDVIPHVPYEDVIEDFKEGLYGEYAVVRKDDMGDFEAYRQYILDNIIYESDYAYIIQR